MKGKEQRKEGREGKGKWGKEGKGREKGRAKGREGERKGGRKERRKKEKKHGGSKPIPLPSKDHQSAVILVNLK